MGLFFLPIYINIFVFYIVNALRHLCVSLNFTGRGLLLFTLNVTWEHIGAKSAVGCTINRFKLPSGSFAADRSKTVPLCVPLSVLRFQLFVCLLLFSCFWVFICLYCVCIIRIVLFV